MKSPKACAAHFIELCTEFRLSWTDLISLQFGAYDKTRLFLFPKSFARVAAQLNVKRKRFDVDQDGEYLHVSFRARSAMWTTMVRRRDEAQWKMMHDALRLPELKTKSLPAPEPKRIPHRQLCLPAPKE